MRINVFKRMFTLLLPALLVLTMLPMSIFAAETDNTVEIRLKAGSPTVKINGKASTVQAPYVTQGTTMVPLKIVTNAFGAGLKLENGNVISLSYNDRKVVLTFGSKIVKINGVDKTVAVAPVVVKGSTMVPLRVIVEAFGAKITADAVTKETVIKGVRAQSAGSGGTSIDADFGKTKVGDSYQGWSMNYPAGLVQTYQSVNGNFVRWADAKEAASVVVITEEIDNELTSDEVRDQMYMWFEHDELTIDGGEITIGELTFQKIISRSKDNKMYYEYRGIQVDDTFYIIVVGVQATNKAALNGYQAQLNSFKPSFNKVDSSVKDISKVKNGLFTIKDADYGLSMMLPVGWDEDKDSVTPSYFSKNDSIEFSLTSAVAGDTVEKWAARREAALKENFTSSYIRNISISPLNIKDGNALVLNYEITYNQKDWVSSKELLIIVGDYKYLLDYYFGSSTTATSTESFNKIIATVDYDTAFVQKTFGQVKDNNDFIDYTKKVTKRSSKFGYSIEIPTYWMGAGINFNEELVSYYYLGGGMSILQNDNIKAREMYDVLTQFPNTEMGKKENSQLIDYATITINGKAGYKVTLHHDNSSMGIPYTEYLYAFDLPNGTMLYSFTLNDANATPANVQRITDAAQSIRFN